MSSHACPCVHLFSLFSHGESHLQCTSQRKNSYMYTAKFTQYSYSIFEASLLHSPLARQNGVPRDKILCLSCIRIWHIQVFAWFFLVLSMVLNFYSFCSFLEHYHIGQPRKKYMEFSYLTLKAMQRRGIEDFFTMVGGSYYTI